MYNVLQYQYMYWYSLCCLVFCFLVCSLAMMQIQQAVTITKHTITSMPISMAAPMLTYITSQHMDEWFMPVGFAGASELGRMLGVSLATDTVTLELMIVEEATVVNWALEFAGSDELRRGLNASLVTAGDTTVVTWGKEVVDMFAGWRRGVSVLLSARFSKIIKQKSTIQTLGGAHSWNTYI